jgi:hypothetical protein
MRHLEKELLPPVVRARLSVDARADAERLQKPAGKDVPVTAWREPLLDGREVSGSGSLRRFLPPEEGGIDQTKPGTQVVFIQELVPWRALPPLFDDERNFPTNVGLGKIVRSRFALPFVEVLEPNRPRDLMLRGRFTRAIPDLVTEEKKYTGRLDRLALEENLEKRVAVWVQEQALPTYTSYQAVLEEQKAGRGDPQAVAEAGRRVDIMWAEFEPWRVLLDGAGAGPRLVLARWLLALCKHEQAEQPQARIDAALRRGAQPSPADVEAAAAAWQDACHWWRQYDQLPEAPNRAQARRNLARGLAAQGDRDAAIRVLEDTVTRAPMEKIALLYEAAQLKAK